MEHEHGEEFGIRFAQVDFLFKKWLTARVGMFLVPFGHYNERSTLSTSRSFRVGRSCSGVDPIQWTVSKSAIQVSK